MSRVLLLTSTRSYSAEDFLRAAERLHIELMLGTDRCHVLAEVWPEGALALDFRDPEAAAAAIAGHADARSIVGIVPTDEITSVIAAHAASALGLGRNPIRAAEAAGNKLHLREVLGKAGLPQPRFVDVDVDASLEDVHAAMAAAGMGYPVVVKPLHLTASRGVMRASDEREARERLARLATLLRDPEVRARDPGAASRVLVEEFLAGPEVAYEGLLVKGVMHTLAIFDKPEPLDGPFFAETLYVTPSLEPDATQAAIAGAARLAARAMGLADGPVHAELRLTRQGPVVIELAARSIGGLCNRALRFGAGLSLEELILSHAAGRDIGHVLERVAEASGVYMLPVPRAGILREVHGVDEARAIPGVVDVVMTVREGEHVLPLPEGHVYMGFIFATGPDPRTVARILGQASQALRFRIVPTL